MPLPAVFLALLRQIDSVKREHERFAQSTILKEML